MKIAVSSLGTSLESWAGAPFDACQRFLVVDTETMDFVVLSVSPEEQTPLQARLALLRAIANQGAQVVLSGRISDVCRQTLLDLGIEVIADIPRMTVREAITRYASGPATLKAYEPPPERIAVATHGDNLEAKLGPQAAPCTSFVLVDPRTMDYQLVPVEPAESPVQASLNAVRAAARSGATVVITPAIRPACCVALRALGIAVAIADEELTVREAVAKFARGELETLTYF